MPLRTMEVNYNQIAKSYNQRYESNGLAGVEQALLKAARKVKASQVLEVGCGTGHWLESFSGAALQVFGLDLSTGMLIEAQKKSQGFQLTCGRASNIPIQNQTFDLIYCVNALHHFNNPRRFIVEAGSLLKPGGCLAIIGQNPGEKYNRWYIYDYFEGIYETDLDRFPPWSQVTDWMINIGFESISCSVAEYIDDHRTGRNVFDDPFLRKEAVSQLALLSDKEYKNGLQRIEISLKKAENAGIQLDFPTKIRLDMLTGIINRTL